MKYIITLNVFTYILQLVSYWCILTLLQGLMMGLISAAGSGGRTVGPLLLANVYYVGGPRTTFLVCIGIIIAALIILLAFYRRLVPYSVHCQKLRNTKLSNLNPDSDQSESYKSKV